MKVYLKEGKLQFQIKGKIFQSSTVIKVKEEEVVLEEDMLTKDNLIRFNKQEEEEVGTEGEEEASESKLKAKIRIFYWPQ